MVGGPVGAALHLLASAVVLMLRAWGSHPALAAALMNRSSGGVPVGAARF